jgi:hypothetical protein
MPIRRRSFFAAAGVLAGAVSRPVRAAEGGEERILLVGDSQAQGLAAGLQRLYRHDRVWRIIDRSRIATGLASLNRFDWPAAVPAIAAAERGAIGVVMFGANDRPVIRVNGRVDAAFEAKFCSVYGGRVAAVAEAMHKSCGGVIWVGHPIVRDAVYAEDMVLLNRLYAERAAAAGAEWFPSWPLFVDSAGGYSAYGKGVDGVTTRLRADDGVHFTPAGYDVLAKALQPQIGRYRPLLSQAAG